MPFDLQQKLVIAIASSALFDLSESEAVFTSKGEDAYRKYQISKLDEPLPRGMAYPFIKRLLALNKLYPETSPVEVVFLSKNDPDSGRRIYRSAQYYQLNITRGAFLTGRSPYSYIPAFNTSIFLSADKSDVLSAVDSGYPAGVVLPGKTLDDDDDIELRVAFDFDGVVINDEAEKIYQKTKNLELFHSSELKKKNIPHEPGPLRDLLEKISRFQRMEAVKAKKQPGYKPALRVAIITARNAPSNERFVTTMNEWGITIDETFFLGGIEKSRILKVLKPHIFFDDQMMHLEATSRDIPSVHIPFGISNKPKE